MGLVSLIVEIYHPSESFHHVKLVTRAVRTRHLPSKPLVLKLFDVQIWRILYSYLWLFSWFLSNRVLTLECLYYF